MRKKTTGLLTGWTVALLLSTLATAQAPPEVTDVRLEKRAAGEILTFPFLPLDPQFPIRFYTVYRGSLAGGFDPGFTTLRELRQIVDADNGNLEGYTAINDSDTYVPGESFYFLTTATNDFGEGSLGPSSAGPRGGIFGDPPNAPHLQPEDWVCEPYVGEPPPPFPPPIPPGTDPPVFFEFPELCPPGMVPQPREFAGVKGSPEAGNPPSAPPGYMQTGQYWYATAETAPSFGYDDGAFTQIWIESPVIDNLPQTHSLAEMASRAGFMLGDYVEIGWTVDRLVNGGSVAPSLFVFRWINGVPSPVYNGGGWVQASGNVAPGMRLPTGWVLPAGFVNFAGNWWAFVITSSGGGWIGYFPGSLWGGSFNNLTWVQWFGEVWANNTPPNNEMGNGIRASMNSGPRFPTRFSLLSTIDTGVLSGTFYQFPAQNPTWPAYYDTLVTGNPNGQLIYGGPGR